MKSGVVSEDDDAGRRRDASSGLRKEAGESGVELFKLHAKAADFALVDIADEGEVAEIYDIYAS